MVFTGRTSTKDDCKNFIMFWKWSKEISNDSYSIPWVMSLVQCGQSSPSQRWGADLRAHCSVKFPMTPKMGLERSQLFPEIFEIVLRPFWWAAGSEQPSPPLRSPEAGELLSKIWDAACLYTKEFSNWTEQPPTLPGKLTPHLPMRFHQCFGSLNPDFWMRLFWQKWAKMYWDSMENFTFCDFFTFWHQNAILKARKNFGPKSS